MMKYLIVGMLVFCASLAFADGQKWLEVGNRAEGGYSFRPIQVNAEGNYVIDTTTDRATAEKRFADAGGYAVLSSEVSSRFRRG